MPLFKPKRPLEFITGEEHMGNPSKTSRFINDFMSSIFQISGVPCHVYRLIGTFEQERDEIGIKRDTHGTTSGGLDVMSFLDVQDPVLNENRDRAYDFDEIPVVKGIYQVSQSELELMRFGFKSNETITMEFHERDVSAKLGRRIAIGDVVELPHLRDTTIEGKVANRWYEVVNVSWSPGGYDHYFYRHVLAVVLEPIRHQQQFLDILENVRDESGKTVAEQISTKERLVSVNKHIQDLARKHAGTVMFDTHLLYYDPRDPNLRPERFEDDMIPPGLLPVDQGIEFPANPSDGEWFIRVDLYPNRLYQFLNGKWRLVEIDRKREWQPYNWIKKFREHMRDGTETKEDQPYDLRSVHDVSTDREMLSDPSKPTAED